MQESPEHLCIAKSAPDAPQSRRMESPRQSSKIQLLREHGRRLRLDDDAEQRLLVAASGCSWKPGSFELFRDVIILARDTGMRNQRELYCMRTENLDWNNRIIFVPDSKTADGRRMIPMSDRVYELLRVRAEGKGEGWLFPSNRSKCGHLTDLAKQFRATRAKAGLAKDLVLYCSRHERWFLSRCASLVHRVNNGWIYSRIASSLR